MVSLIVESPREAPSVPSQPSAWARKVASLREMYGVCSDRASWEAAEEAEEESESGGRLWARRAHEGAWEGGLEAREDEEVVERLGATKEGAAEARRRVAVRSAMWLRVEGAAEGWEGSAETAEGACPRRASFVRSLAAAAGGPEESAASERACAGT
jgi:hypothetical protein